MVGILGPAHSQPIVNHGFKIEHGGFLLDGKPFQIIAGEMHPARIPKEYWRHRLQMAKACGLNTVSVYLFWNMLEPEKGKFDFRGQQDVGRFIKIAQEEGLYVLLRPGPYVCAEWDFGGFPYWLLTEKGLVVRSNNPGFIKYVDHFFAELGKQLVPLQVDHGGNILMVQVENEYGSYGNDKAYLGKIRDGITKAGFTMPLFTCDGSSQMPAGRLSGILPALNGAVGDEVFKTIDKFQAGGPYLVPEYYPGWLDHWGEPKSRTATRGVVQATKWFLEKGVSFSYYMFHGGTNFAFTNGANYGGHFQPSITSYDYDAPVDESGRPTPKYFAIREAIRANLGKSLPPVPASNPIIHIAKFALKETAAVLDNLPMPKLVADSPKPMEELGQAFGYTLYRTTVQGPVAEKLSISELRDFAAVMVDGKRVGLLDRRRKESSMPIELSPGSHTLDILVENGGRINYGREILDNLKGITRSVSLGDKELKGWQMFTLPVNSVKDLKFIPGPAKETPSYYRGWFELPSTGDTFLDMRGWYKGVVLVNGHNLGRYWWIGAQQTLYVPGPWLRKGRNEIVVLDLGQPEANTTEGLTDPILSTLRQEASRRKPRPVLSAAPAIKSSDVVVEGEFAYKDQPTDVSFAKARSGRYLVFETLSSQAGDDFASCAELWVLGKDGKPLKRDKWRIYWTDSEEVNAESGHADNLIDDDPESIWHSVWASDHTKNPHVVIIDLGEDTECYGVRYLPRQGRNPAKTKGFRFYVSTRL